MTFVRRPWEAPEQEVDDVVTDRDIAKALARLTPRDTAIIDSAFAEFYGPTSYKSGDEVVFTGQPWDSDDPEHGSVGEVVEEVFDDGRTDVRLGQIVSFGGATCFMADSELDAA